MTLKNASASRVFRCQRGATVIEYSLLVALLTLVCVPTLSGLSAGGSASAARFVDALSPAPHNMSDHISTGGDDHANGSDRASDDSGFNSAVNSLHNGGGSNGTVTCENDNCNNATVDLEND